MFKIEIKGVEFNNKGAELMLLSIIQALDIHLHTYQLVLSPGHLLPYEKRAKLGAWQKFSFSFFGIDWTWLGNLFPTKIRKMLHHFGIIVEKDIDIVLDASGFVYSDEWGENRLKKTLKQLTKMQKNGQCYIFLPQAFGPFTGKNDELMQKIIAKSQLIITRDQVSYKHVSLLAKRGEALCFPDFTTLLSVNKISLPEHLPTKYVCVIPNHKMFSQKSPADKKCYIQFLITSIKAIEECGLTPVLLNHEGKEDYDICLTIVEQNKNKLIILNELDALKVKKVIAQSFFCISSRFHGCISSLSQGVPAISTSWSHKYEELYRSYQCEDFLLETTISKVELLKKIEKIINQREQQSRKLLRLSQIHNNQCKAMWKIVFDKMQT
ncbi:polysaccharide pyruvyl transferase family protein [Colwellia sp. C1TZA3]|uniref:polysaccharide pyruvyl transferase family protein n=1 Tax=Colwellia sp. C1TZA3 TaxID=2508879 RepID=UPI0011BA3012|nr:polysaccharide pyruvyl transferase family protein [Colwellia sp. C1TZA3]TWX73065.1 polysaccharide pyruvyl transferase family protein [Colwellia sp. C1TZA3]